jgi:LPXTG-motif cell wall-anchored protein
LTTRTLVRAAFWLATLSVLVLSLLPTSTPLPSTGWDKSNHVLGFAVLAMLGSLAYRRQEFRVAVGLFAFGVLIEVLQAFSGYRFAEWGDLLSDVIGIGVGIIATWLAGRTLPMLR